MVEMGLVEPRGANSIPFRYNGCTLLSLSQVTIGTGSICPPRNVGIGRDTCLVSLMGASFEQTGSTMRETALSVAPTCKTRS